MNPHEELIREHHRVPDDAFYRGRIWREVEDGRRARMAVCLSSREWALPGMPASDASWWYCLETPVKPKTQWPVFMSESKAREWVYELEAL